MSVSMSSIQGLVLELRVTGCRKLRDTELFSRQDPYVIIEYANNKLRTRTCTELRRLASGAMMTLHEGILTLEGLLLKDNDPSYLVFTAKDVWKKNRTKILVPLLFTGIAVTVYYILS